MTRLRRHLQLSDGERSREVKVQQLLDCDGWPQLFEFSGDLWLEVGTGKDTHIIDRASRFDRDLHVGIEQCRKKFEMTLRKAEALSCGQNLKFVQADAFDAIDPLFADDSLAGAFILFPDPWPKARHARRRLLQSSFLTLIARKLRPGAPLEIRTDDPSYASQAQDSLAGISSLVSRTEAEPWLYQPLDLDVHVETLFEKRFRSKGLPIHHFYLQKTKDAAIA
ncbi:MAG: hypothetical protein OSB09_05300 [Planctomycetota bacterium]|nr:hypothetical protein [Planctomycetota bacterium]